MRICDQPGYGWAVDLRRRLARVVQGRPDGGCTGAFEIICCHCGDHRYLDYREVSTELQLIRQMTGAGAGGQVIGCDPADAFVNVRVFPAEPRDAVRPGFGTFYSVAGHDLRDEPPIVSVPSTGGCLTPVERR